MKKEDLYNALQVLRSQLESDKIVDAADRCLKNDVAPDRCHSFRNSIVAWIVSGKGHFDRLSPLQLDVAKQLGIFETYASELTTQWLPYWANIPSVPPTGEMGGFLAFLQSYRSTIFIEAHRRLICCASLLANKLRTAHNADEFIAEVIIEDADPQIEDVEHSLRLIRELAKAFCAAFHPDEACIIRVSYLDMGSNYQVGVKVDAKAEIGSNLAKFLTQILKFVTNPRAFIHASRIETLRQRVEAFAELQKRVVAGEISREVGELLAGELFGAAKKLTTHGVFPASLLKEKEETNTVQEFRSLITESSFQTALPEPKFELPQKSESSQAVE